MKRKEDGVFIEGVAPDAADNLFNRASGRVHGYSSRLSRYLRLSIGFRASIGYSLLMLRLLIPFAILLIVLYGFLQAPNYIALQREAVELLPNPGIAGVEVVAMLPEDEDTNGMTVYEGWGFYWCDESSSLYLRYLEPDDGGGYTQILFPLNEDLRVLGGLLIGLCLLVGLTIVNFMTRGRRVNAKLLRPVHEITETAQQMSEKNLSARINVAGTQNELRDLAVVINDMLNRIEAAYNRQKQFVSDASHELRTPIAVLQGYAGLLERWGKDNPDVRDEAIAAISSETQSMKELVENLLFLARHDKKTLSLSMEPFDSAGMLRELVKETEIIAKEHHILTGSIAEVTVVGDRASIKQGVRIFVDNALKYTPSAGSVEVSSELVGGHLRMTVSDSGPGIKKADLARIFDRFFRTDEVRSGSTSGHGLGLAIARIIAASHRGRIIARSQPGVGSAFTLEVPVKPSAQIEKETGGT